MLVYGNTDKTAKYIKNAYYNRHPTDRDTERERERERGRKRNSSHILYIYYTLLT